MSGDRCGLARPVDEPVNVDGRNEAAMSVLRARRRASMPVSQCVLCAVGRSSGTSWPKMRFC